MLYKVYNHEYEETVEYNAEDAAKAGEMYAEEVYSLGTLPDAFELDVTDEEGTIWGVTVDVDVQVSFDGFAVVRKRNRGPYGK